MVLPVSSGPQLSFEASRREKDKGKSFVLELQVSGDWVRRSHSHFKKKYCAKQSALDSAVLGY